MSGYAEADFLHRRRRPRQARDALPRNSQDSGRSNQSAPPDYLAFEPRAGLPWHTLHELPPEREAVELDGRAVSERPELYSVWPPQGPHLTVSAPSEPVDRAHETAEDDDRNPPAVRKQPPSSTASDHPAGEQGEDHAAVGPNRFLTPETQSVASARTGQATEDEAMSVPSTADSPRSLGHDSDIEVERSTSSGMIEAVPVAQTTSLHLRSKGRRWLYRHAQGQG